MGWQALFILSHMVPAKYIQLFTVPFFRYCSELYGLKDQAAIFYCQILLDLWVLLAFSSIRQLFSRFAWLPHGLLFTSCWKFTSWMFTPYLILPFCVLKLCLLCCPSLVGLFLGIENDSWIAGVILFAIILQCTNRPIGGSRIQMSLKTVSFNTL